MSLTLPQLNNPKVFNDKSYVDGEWVESRSSKRFGVIGITQSSPLVDHC